MGQGFFHLRPPTTDGPAILILIIHPEMAYRRVLRISLDRSGRSPYYESLFVLVSGRKGSP
jgi:hypothetical protein